MVRVLRARSSSAGAAAAAGQAARSGVLRGRAGCADVRGRVQLHREVGVHLRKPQQRCCHLQERAELSAMHINS